MRRTREEILAEVAKLKKMKPNVRPYDVFGGDNRARCQIEIDTLQAIADGEIEDPDDVADGYDDSDERSSAEFAASWAFGKSSEEDGSPSENWAGLAA